AAGNQVLVPPGGKQRAGMRVEFPGLGGSAVPHHGDLSQVPDPRRQDLSDQVEQGEVDQRDAVGVGGVLVNRQVGGVAEEVVQHVVGLAGGRHDHLGAERGVLIGNVGVRGQDL